MLPRLLFVLYNIYLLTTEKCETGSNNNHFVFDKLQDFLMISGKLSSLRRGPTRIYDVQLIIDCLFALCRELAPHAYTCIADRNRLLPHTVCARSHNVYKSGYASPVRVNPFQTVSSLEHHAQIHRFYKSVSP